MANPVEVTKQVGETSQLRFGTTNTATANTAKALASLVVNLKHGVKLRAPGTGDAVPNTDEVYIGDASVVASNGFALNPGDSLELKINNLNQLYVFSPTANQSVEWIGL